MNRPELKMTEKEILQGIQNATLMLAYFTALKNGEPVPKIQFKRTDADDWEDIAVTRRFFMHNFDYRIKPNWVPLNYETVNPYFGVTVWKSDEHIQSVSDDDRTEEASPLGTIRFATQYGVYTSHDNYYSYAELAELTDVDNFFFRTTEL